jgi:hypothetical protein
MSWDDWDFEGHESRVEYWRSIVPALSIAPDADRTGIDNSAGRVADVQQRYLLELKQIGHAAVRRRPVASSRVCRIGHRWMSRNAARDVRDLRLPSAEEFHRVYAAPRGPMAGRVRWISR